jgi:hypothetical protein
LSPGAPREREQTPRPIALSCSRGYVECAEKPAAAEGAGFRRLPTDLEGGVVESRHGLAQRRRKGTRRAFRKRPGDAGGRAALHPLHARQQNNIGSIGRRMDSPAAVPPSPREDGATATPPRRSPPRVSAPPLRHRRDHPEYHHPAALLSPHGAYAAAPVSRFLQRFECRFCCLRVAAACTRALARARPILFFRVPPRFATLPNSAAMKQFIS